LLQIAAEKKVTCSEVTFYNLLLLGFFIDVFSRKPSLFSVYMGGNRFFML